MAPATVVHARLGQASQSGSKRNDTMLKTLPIGVLHFPGSGINDNLADKAKKLGIRVWKFGGA